MLDLQLCALMMEYGWVCLLNVWFACEFCCYSWRACRVRVELRDDDCSVLIWMRLINLLWPGAGFPGLMVL